MTREEIAPLYRDCMTEVAQFTPSAAYDAYSLRWKAACAEKFVGLPPGRVLVPGCKYGTELVFLCRLGWWVVGVDVDGRVPPEMLAKYRFCVLEADLEDPRTWQTHLGAFDLVLFSEVLEHFAFAPLEPLRWFRGQMKPDAPMVLSTPDAATYFPLPADLGTRRECHWREVPTFDAQVPRNSSVHSKQYEDAELRDLLAEAGFEVVTVERIEAQGDHLLAVAVAR